MKFNMFFFSIVLLSAVLISCSDDDKVTKARDADVTHVGEKWNITAVNYILTEQNLSGGVGQSVKVGTKGTGFFYFDFENTTPKGSFELDVEGYHKEDVFNVSVDANNGLTLTSIAQSVDGGQISQNVVVASGDRVENEITLDGSIVKQTTSGQFILAIESITLVKE